MNMTCVDDILINDQLMQRATRPPQLKVENEGLHHLMEQFSCDSQAFLDAVVMTACRLCGADSAGISLAENAADGSELVRWVAATG